MSAEIKFEYLHLSYCLHDNALSIVMSVFDIYEKLQELVLIPCHCVYFLFEQ